MALTKVRAGGVNLADTFAFTGTVSGSGMDLLLNSTISSAVAQFDISSTYMNSTYDDYQVLATLFPSSDNIHLIMSVFESGSVLTGDKYCFEAASHAGSTYLQSNSIHRFGMNYTQIGGNVGEGITLNFTCSNVNSTTQSFCYGGNAEHFNSSGNLESQSIGGSLLVANRDVVVNGLRISFESGNITSGIVKVYGISK